MAEINTAHVIEKKISKLEAAKKWEKEKERDLEMVTGIFEYKERPRQTLKMRYKKYADDEFKEYHFTDGQRYRIPRMLAKHLNNNIKYAEYKRLNLPNGMASDLMAGGVADERSPESQMYATHYIKRTEFKSLEFFEEDLNTTKEIIQVSYR